VQSQDLVKNRILQQLSADELKSAQLWLTPVELRSNAVLHEPGDAIEQVYFPLSGMGLRRNVPGGGKRVAGTGHKLPSTRRSQSLTDGQNRVWGPERIQIYNDASRAFMGTKHPGALGRPGREDGARYGRRTRRGTSVPPDQDP
jgi:hypothetical protein